MFNSLKSTSGVSESPLRSLFLSFLIFGSISLLNSRASFATDSTSGVGSSSSRALKASLNKEELKFLESHSTTDELQAVEPLLKSNPNSGLSYQRRLLESKIKHKN